MGKNGRLGHNSENTLETPQRVDYFSGNNVRSVACGTRHTLALTNDGQIYSWGFGGGSPNLYSFTKWFRRPSALGHGVNVDSFSPAPIEVLQNEKIVQATAGHDFSFALAENGKVYGWGSGLTFHTLRPTSIPVEI